MKKEIDEIFDKAFNEALSEALDGVIDLLKGKETPKRLKKLMDKYEEDKDDDFKIEITRTDGNCHTELEGNAITIILVLMYQIDKLKEYLMGSQRITEAELEILLKHYKIRDEEEN